MKHRSSMAARTKKEMGPSIWDLQVFVAGGPEGHGNNPNFKVLLHRHYSEYLQS